MKAPRTRQPKRSEPSPAPSASTRGTPVLILACAIAAVAAFWLTRLVLPASRPIVVSTNTVVIPPPNRPLTNLTDRTGNNLTALAPPTSANSTTQTTFSIEGDPPPIDTNDPVQLVNRGTDYLNHGLLDQAIDHYVRAIQINAQDEEAHFNLGFAYMKKGDSEKALANYKKAIELFPEYGEAHNNLGNLLVQLKRYDEALPHFAEAIRINPDNSSAYNNRGRCLAEQGKPAAALAQFQRAVEIYTNYTEARYNLGICLLQLGRPTNAIQEFELLRAQSPDFAPAVSGLQRASNLLHQMSGRAPSAPSSGDPPPIPLRPVGQ